MVYTIHPRFSVVGGVRGKCDFKDCFTAIKITKQRIALADGLEGLWFKSWQEKLQIFLHF